MRVSWSQILGRVLAIVGGLLLAGVVIQLVVAALRPVLPAVVMKDITAGWNMLYSTVRPAAAPIFALLILGAVIYIALGRR